MTQTIATVVDPRCLAHVMGDGHPERPARLQTLIDCVNNNLWALPLRPLPGRPATDAEILRVHSAEHLATIRATEGRFVSLDPDTTACPQSLDAARRAAGCGIAATEAVIQGTVSSAFALIRPPGHHAEPDRVMGFCFFNNAAIAARHAVHELGLHKVAIVDFDVHHGNGTQSAFYDDPRVLYLSTHQFPFYPGTGGVDETGRGAGAGSTINIPLRIGHGDREYAAIYGALVPRVLEQFGPELIIVSAGLDMMAQDPLGGMGVTAQGVYQIAHALVACADRICDGRIVFVLEGGYDLSALTQGVGACLTAMASDSAGDQAIETLDESALGDARMHLPVYRDLFRI